MNKGSPVLTFAVMEHLGNLFHLLLANVITYPVHGSIPAQFSQVAAWVTICFLRQLLQAHSIAKLFQEQSSPQSYNGWPILAPYFAVPCRGLYLPASLVCLLMHEKLFFFFGGSSSLHLMLSAGTNDRPCDLKGLASTLQNQTDFTDTPSLLGTWEM